MNFSWVISDNAQLDPTVNLNQLKDIGSTWGSWRTWRIFQTDNVICHDMAKASDLLNREFHKNCNFYIPNSVYTDLGSPPGVKLYEGNFVHEVDHHEEIVSMHLAASTSDIVLLLGFDFTERQPSTDRLIEHKAHNYRSLVLQAINSNPEVQWLAIDHAGEVEKNVLNLTNFSTDILDNVFGML